MPLIGPPRYNSGNGQPSLSEVGTGSELSRQQRTPARRTGMDTTRHTRGRYLAS
jgi:hypothetical protein